MFIPAYYIVTVAVFILGLFAFGLFIIWGLSKQNQGLEREIDCEIESIERHMSNNERLIRKNHRLLIQVSRLQDMVKEADNMANDRKDNPDIIKAVWARKMLGENRLPIAHGACVFTVNLMTGDYGSSSNALMEYGCIDCQVVSISVGNSLCDVLFYKGVYVRAVDPKRDELALIELFKLTSGR